MKKLFLLFFVAAIVGGYYSCKQEDETYDAVVKIDSLHQDSIFFGTQHIPENLHVYYSVKNNDFADMHNYFFTVKVTTVDSAVYTYEEQSDVGVKGNTVKTGEFEMGLGGKACVWAMIDSYTFE